MTFRKPSASADGHALVEFGVEISEQLDVVPEHVRVIQHPRVKLCLSLL
jgi:transposase